MKYIYGLLIAIGAIGFIGVLLYNMANEMLNDNQYNWMLFTALSSMAFMLLGIHGCNECKKRCHE